MTLAVVGTPAVASDGGNPGPSGITSNFTLDATCDLLIVAVAWATTSTRTVSSLTWNDVALSQVTGAWKEALDATSSYRGVDFWYLVNPATGLRSLATNMSGTCQSLDHGVIGFSGASVSAPVFKASANGTANPASQATTSTAGNTVVGLITVQTVTGSNVTSNNTQAFEASTGFQLNTTVNASYDTASSPTMSWANAASNYWTLTSIEVAQAAPLFTQHPTSKVVTEGNQISFSIAATYTTSYQWQRNDGAGYNDLSGEVATTYTSGTLSIAADNNDLYRCAATGPGGTTYSNAATLKVIPVSYISHGMYDPELRSTTLFDKDWVTPAWFDKDWIVVTYGASGQTLTPSLFTNANTFNAHTLGIGAVSLTAGLFTNSNTFNAHVISTGGATQTLTATRFDNVNTFNAHVLGIGTVALTATRFDSSQTYYTHTLARGAVNLSATRFDNSNTFNAHSLTASITLNGTRFDNSSTFNAHSIAASIALNGTRFDNSQTFYAATIGQAGGAQTLTAALFTNDNQFFSTTLSSTVVLGASRYDSSNTFYAANIGQAGALQTLTASLFTNSNQFFNGTISGLISLTASRYDNAGTFYAASVNSSITLASSRFDNSNQFFTASVIAGSVGLTASLLSNTNAFYTATLTNVASSYNLTLTLAQVQRLEAVWRLHGLGSALVVTPTSRGDGTVTQTLSGTGPVTVTTTALPVGQQPLASWVDDMARWYGLIDPMIEQDASRSDGTLSQTVVTAGDTTTVTRL